MGKRKRDEKNCQPFCLPGQPLGIFPWFCQGHLHPEHCAAYVACQEAIFFGEVLQRLRQKLWQACDLKEMAKVMEMINGFLLASAAKERALAATMGQPSSGPSCCCLKCLKEV